MVVLLTKMGIKIPVFSLHRVENKNISQLDFNMFYAPINIVTGMLMQCCCGVVILF